MHSPKHSYKKVHAWPVSYDSMQMLQVVVYHKCMHTNKIILCTLSMHVPLGIMQKSESNYEDMADIMSNSMYRLKHPGIDEVYRDCRGHTPYSLIWLRSDDCCAGTWQPKNPNKTRERGKDRLEGLQPVCEDWNAKVCKLTASVFINALKGCLVPMIDINFCGRKQRQS